MRVHTVSHTVHTEYRTQCRTHQLVSLWLYLTHFWVINLYTMNYHVKAGVGNHLQFPDMPHTWGTYSKIPLICHLTTKHSW